MINEMIDSILSRLRAKIPDPVKVEHFPDTPKGYQFAGTLASVYLRWHADTQDEGSIDLRRSRACGIISQDMVHTFIVSVISRKLRASSGIYELVTQIKHALRGFVPIPGASKMWVEHAGYIEAEKGEWHYEIWVSCMTPEVEAGDTELPPFLHHATLEQFWGAEEHGLTDLVDIVENEAPDPADETVTFTRAGESRTEPMPPHKEPEEYDQF